jgi:hypothetical protein
MSAPFNMNLQQKIHWWLQSIVATVQRQRLSGWPS